MTRKLLLATVLCLATVFVPLAARAEFVCSTTYIPGPTAAGQSPGPRVRLVTTSSPNCGGSTKTWWFCHKLGAQNICAGPENFRMDKAELLTHFQLLSAAAASQKRISVELTTCLGGSGNCAYFVNFNGS
jgi:hypothetical protein